MFAGDVAHGRLRRPVDALLVLLAALLFVIASVIADTAEADEPDVVEATATLLGWFDTAWRAVYALTLAYAVVIVSAAVLTRRWRVSRDLVLAVAAVVVVAVPVGRLVRSDWPSLTEDLWEASDQYPAVRLAAAVAVLAVAGPELTRTARRWAVWLAAAGGTGAVALGIAYPSSVLGALALGLAVGGVVRLVFGSTRGFPSPARVVAGLTELGVPIERLRVAARQRPGAATYTAVDADTTPLSVVVLGRDAQDTQRLANTWRNLAFRDAALDLATGRLHQIEHESLITLLAERSGVPAPVVRVAGVVSSGDAILVTEQPDAPAAEATTDGLPDQFVADLWRHAATLRAARLAHGALNLGNVLVTDDGPVIVHFQRGRLAAPGPALDIDLAELLVATCLATSPDRALAAALDSVGPAGVVAALPFLQRAALTPHLRDRARHHELDLEALRAQAAEATGVQVPEIAPMRRVRPRDVLLMVLVGVAAYLVISQLAEIGFDTIYDQLRAAEWAWLALALAVAQLTFVTQAISLRGAVLTPLPLLPCVALESALKFIGLTVPTDAARVAVNIRFLQRLGVPTGEAVAAGAVDGISDTLIRILIVLLVLPFVDLDLRPSTGGGASDVLWIVVVLVVVAVGVVGVVLAVPRWRAKVVPTVQTGLSSLRAVARMPSKRAQLFGGNLATQVLFALTLGAVAHAYGIDLNLAELLLVNTGATVFAGLVPVPGGIGVAEAGLTAGLVAVGVDEATAFALALSHRLCTYYLPPIWGYLALRWLNRKAYL